MACKKCDPHEICEECPEWIFTLADLIMCMMGLFVLLWVLKESGSKAATPQQAQQIEQEWMRGFQQGFQGYIPTDQPDQQSILRKLNGPGERGETNEQQDSLEGTQSQTSIIRPGQETAVGGRLSFARGEVALSAKSKGELDIIADRIRGHRNIVQVKGHASHDDLGADGTPAAAMELALTRAQMVASYLTSRGIDAEILRVQGCSTFEPVRQGDSSLVGQSLNRRVEVYTTETLVDALQGRVPTARPLDAIDGPKPAAASAGH